MREAQPRQMAGKKPERVLVVGDDMRIFLAVVRSLGRAGKEVQAAPFDWRAPALTSKYIAKVHRLPRYSDDPQGWLAALLKLLDEEAIDLVVPCCDRAILPLDAHREALFSYRIAIPNARAMDLLFDKQRTKALAQSLGIPVSAGAQLGRDDSAPSLAARFGLPLVVKPRRSYWLDRLESWGKVHIAEDVAALAGVLASLDDPPRYLAEAFFERGVGVGLSVLADEGAILQAFQHRRMREGWGGSSSYRISEALQPDLLDACRKLCAATRLTGVCMFEFRRNADDGSWILLETNARFWGSLPLPVAIGVDFPLRLFNLLVEGQRPPAIGYRSGIRSRNIVLDAFNLLAGLRRLPPGGLPRWLLEVGDFLLQPARWLAGREHADSFAADDFAPGFAECGAVLRSLGARTNRGFRLRRRSDRPQLSDAGVSSVREPEAETL